MPESAGVILAAAVLLSLERISYVWISWRPEAFARACAVLPGPWRDPVKAVRTLFLAFKVIQAVVFAGWMWHFGGRHFALTDSPAAWGVAIALVAAGQVLNLGVFYRLGWTGAFYGAQFGRPIAWTSAFPFSLTSHPQYVGTVLTIWGVFLIGRFPHPDWYVLPAIETVYYGLGARYEA